MIKDRRVGRFMLSTEFVTSEVARRIMGACSIVRCEHYWSAGYFDYLAISPLFDEVPPQMVPPEYRWVIRTVGPLDVVSIKAMRLAGMSARFTEIVECA